MEFEPNEVYVIHNLFEDNDTYILHFEKNVDVTTITHIFHVLDEQDSELDLYAIVGKPLWLSTSTLLQNSTIVYKFSDLISNNSNNLCTCSMLDLMSIGCKCGGK